MLNVQNGQRHFYRELDGKMNRQSEAPDPKGSTEFCSKLWSELVEHNRDSKWLKKVENSETH